jgi:hypothetical protein
MERRVPPLRQRRDSGKGSFVHLLFNFVDDILNRMLAKSSRNNLVKGLLGQFREGGILVLQYANDTLLFSSSDREHLKVHLDP